jgi:hypothetical protein
MKMSEGEYEFGLDYHPYYDRADPNKLVAYVNHVDTHILAVNSGTTDIVMGEGWGELWTLTVS